jgi:ketosteroid isomerase-like protein
MSQENVEIVRQVYAEWERGNMRAGVEMFHPEIAFESFMPDSSDAVVAHGPGEVEAFMREFLTQWANYTITGDDFRDAGDQVLVTSRQRARGRQSGVEVEQRIFSVWTFRADKMVRLRFTPFREKALEATGLRD